VTNHFDEKSNLYYKGSLFISFLIGITFRTYHLFIIGFQVPFDLGGLFYQFSIEIIKNGFILPVSIPYYFPGGLPFAYPPLPILSLFGFFFLAQKIISEKIGIVAAVFTFSIIPIAYTEQIEAMGLAESIGTFFLILFTFTLLWARDNKQKFRWIIPGISLGLCIMSSPGSFYASILISILFAGISVANYFSHKDIKYLIACLIVGIVGLAVSFPYWYTVISHHGIGIFSNTFKTQNSNIIINLLQAARNLKLLNISLYWNLFFLIGLLSTLINKNYLLFLFSIFLLPIPRENWIMAIATSLVIGNGIVHFHDLFRSNRKLVKYLEVAIIWLLVLFFVTDSGFALKAMIDNDIFDISILQMNDLKEINKSNLIPSDENVVVIGNWGLIEWSPAIIQRVVVNNPFGLEWMLNRNKMNILLTQTLLQITSPDDTMRNIRKDFNDLKKIYIIAQKSHLHKLNSSNNGVNASYETLQEYDDLGLGIITN